MSIANWVAYWVIYTALILAWIIPGSNFGLYYVFYILASVTLSYFVAKKFNVGDRLLSWAKGLRKEGQT